MEKLNSDLLRTFLAVAETGSVTKGAARIFRSQSAASLQIAKLEDVLGQPVFERHGRGVVPTEAGDKLLPVARDVTRLLDSTLRDLTSDDLHGKLRLGLPDDQSHAVLSRIVAEFAQSHPLVELEITCALSATYPDALASGTLDLAVYEEANPTPDVDILRREQTCWMMSRHHDLLSRDPVPVALFDRDCWWRDAALNALRASDRTYKVIYSSQSVIGVLAAIEAGVAIGLLGENSQTPDLQALSPKQGFRSMPVSHLVLGSRADADSLAIKAMQGAIRRAFAQGA